MASMAPSDSESNVSGFFRYNDENYIHLYTSLVKGMEAINQNILEVENNLKHIVKQAGPLESQLSVLMRELPRPNINMSMEID